MSNQDVAEKRARGCFQDWRAGGPLACRIMVHSRRISFTGSPVPGESSLRREGSHSVLASGSFLRAAKSSATDRLREEVGKGRTPGLQYAIIDKTGVLFACDPGVARVADWTPVTSRTTFNGFSVTKTFTAVAMLQLVGRGLIDLDSSAAGYLPLFPYSTSITIGQLLAHTSGIPNPIPLQWTHLEEESDRACGLQTLLSERNSAQIFADSQCHGLLQLPRIERPVLCGLNE